MRSIALGILLASSLAGVARAQGTCDVVGEATPACVAAPRASALSRAGALYDEGHVHMDGGRWDDALTAFRESYRSSCVAAALLNMVVAYRGLGRWVEARAAARLLVERHPDMPEELRPLAEEYLRESTGRIAVLTLVGVPTEPTPTIRVDGQPCDDRGARPVEVSVDPGRRAVDVSAPGRRAYHWEAQLSPAARRTLEVELPALPSAEDQALPLGLGLGGAAAVLVGVAIGLGVFFGSQGPSFDASVEAALEM